MNPAPLNMVSAVRVLLARTPFLILKRSHWPDLREKLPCRTYLTWQCQQFFLSRPRNTDPETGTYGFVSGDYSQIFR